MKILIGLSILSLVLISGCSQPNTGNQGVSTQSGYSSGDTSDSKNVGQYNPPPPQYQGQYILPPSQQKVCRDVQQPYTTSIPYTTQEPYQDCVDTQIPYQDTETYDYTLNAVSISATEDYRVDLDKGVYAVGQVTLKNTDNQAGWFTVTFNWKTLKRTASDTIRHYIEPDKRVLFESIFDIESGEDNQYTYTYVSDYVQKTRVVTKYRTEQKCEIRYRDVTKYRDETQYKTVEQCG